MAGYNRFAQFYDMLTDNVDYKNIALLVDSFIKRYSSENEVVLDLACGTGSLSEEIARLGYDVVGVDLSEEMLEVAQEKRYDSCLPISYLRQDMTELDLYGAVDCAVCVLDSLNHLADEEQLRKTIERVSMYTCDGGLFIFDLNTSYKHRNVLGNNAYNYDYDGLFCAWQNELCDDDSVKIYLDFFEEQDNGLYERYSESFKEIVYDFDTVDEMLKENGFEIIGRYDDFSEKPVSEQTQRVLYVCRKCS